MAAPVRVLFLCTGNSCRSQMAEGWTRALHAEQIEAHSAGIEARGLDPRAVLVMREAGMEISGQTSKTIDQLDSPHFDLVVTVCDHAAESCPTFAGAERIIHVPFDDPPALAALEAYRRVRDEIGRWARTLPDLLELS